MYCDSIICGLEAAEVVIGLLEKHSRWSCQSGSTECISKASRGPHDCAIVRSVSTEVDDAEDYRLRCLATKKEKTSLLLISPLVSLLFSVTIKIIFIPWKYSSHFSYLLLTTQTCFLISTSFLLLMLNQIVSSQKITVLHYLAGKIIEEIII